MGKNVEEEPRYTLSGSFEEVKEKILKGVELIQTEEDLIWMDKAWKMVEFCRKERFIHEHIDLLNPEEQELYKGMIWLNTNEAFELINERMKKKKRTA